MNSNHKIQFVKTPRGRRAATPVEQLADDGTVLNTFPSQNQAFRSTGIKQCLISKACAGHGARAGGYRWRIVENDEAIAWPRWQNKPMAVDQLDLQGNFLQTFSSQREAALATNTPQCSISACLNDPSRHARNFKWREHKEDEKMEQNVDLIKNLAQALIALGNSLLQPQPGAPTLSSDNSPDPRYVNPPYVKRSSPRLYVRPDRKLTFQILELCSAGKTNAEISQITGCGVMTIGRIRARSPYIKNRWDIIDEWRAKHPHANLFAHKLMRSKW